MSTFTADNSSPPETILGAFSTPNATATPWEATEWALRRIQKYQLCTVRRDGRPHVTPLLAIWPDGHRLRHRRRCEPRHRRRDPAGARDRVQRGLRVATRPRRRNLVRIE